MLRHKRIAVKHPGKGMLMVLCAVAGAERKKQRRLLRKRNNAFQSPFFRRDRKRCRHSIDESNVEEKAKQPSKVSEPIIASDDTDDGVESDGKLNNNFGKKWSTMEDYLLSEAHHEWLRRSPRVEQWRRRQSRGALKPSGRFSLFFRQCIAFDDRSARAIEHRRNRLRKSGKLKRSRFLAHCESSGDDADTDKEEEEEEENDDTYFDRQSFRASKRRFELCVEKKEKEAQSLRSKPKASRSRCWRSGSKAKASRSRCWRSGSADSSERVFERIIEHAKIDATK